MFSIDDEDRFYFHINKSFTYFLNKFVYVKINITFTALKHKTMSTANLTHPLYESKQKDSNEEKYGTMSGNQCICCMKPMAEGETKLVHMNTHWLAVDATKVTEENCTELTGAESQGCFPIGNSCAKKMPKNFIINNTK